MRITELVDGLIGRLEAEAPDFLFEDLRKALQISLNINHDEPPASAIEIFEKTALDVDALIYFDIALPKNQAAEFLISVGYNHSQITIKRQLLRRGRYFERFGRQLLTHKNSNIYTYAELIDIIDRLLIKEQWYAVVGKFKS